MSTTMLHFWRLEDPDGNVIESHVLEDLLKARRNLGRPDLPIKRVDVRRST